VTIDPGGQSGVLITMGRVYEEVTATRRDVGTLTGDVRRALEQGADHEARLRVVEHVGATKQDVEAVEQAHGDRLTALERWRWGAGGVVAVVSMGGSVLIGRLLSGH
jgi:hypothetical protein